MSIRTTIQNRIAEIASHAEDYAKSQLEAIKARREKYREARSSGAMSNETYREKMAALQERENKHKETLKELKKNPARGRGRPAGSGKKAAPAPEVKRSRGRPVTKKEAPAPVAPAKRGRPTTKTEAPAAPAKRGRPTTKKEAPAPVKKSVAPAKRGRPAKVSDEKRGRGRPAQGLKGATVTNRIAAIKTVIKNYQERIKKVNELLKTLEKGKAAARKAMQTEGGVKNRSAVNKHIDAIHNAKKRIADLTDSIERKKQRIEDMKAKYGS